jgi:DNA ligase (NAD+)
LEHFAHKGALDIEGLGEMMVKQLVEHHLVKRIDHIYDLSAEKLSALARMGAKSVANLLSGVEASKHQPLWRLIFGLGIPHVGATASRELAEHFGTLNNLKTASVEELLRVQNTGEIVAKSIHQWFKEPDNVALIEALRRHGLSFGQAEHREPASDRLAGTNWVITGTLTEPREVFAELIRQNGGRLGSSVTRKTDYLLVGEAAGSKLDKARTLGVKAINESGFREMIR